MPQFLRLLLLLLCLGLVLPGVRAEDDPAPPPPADDPADPPEDDPADPPEDPPADPPEDPPKDGEKPDIVEEDDVESEDEPEDEPEPEAAPARMAEQKEFEHAATPAGMLYVPRGTAVIGTKYERLRQDLLRGRAKQVQRDFAFEAPQHQVEMDGFFIDRYEVTNAQYHLFLMSTAISYNSDAAALANLEEVAGHLLGMPRDRWDDDDIAWRQVYEANKEKLHEKMPDTIVKNAAGEIDESATEQAFHYAPLVRGIDLNFYSRKPPETWPSLKPRDTALNHPVMSVSYDDAEAYAEWAGKHVPTEPEWEYAGRGPEGYYWPWGDQWFPDTSRANWGAKNVDEHYNPITMPVDALPEGRSWCGAYNMLGNAGEWTSSWFAAYPGNEREHVSMGEYVKVIRGATYVDLELLVLRLAARNFIGGGIKAPPRPGNRFAYVGFRCAWHEQPGLDQLGPVIRRVSRGRRVTSQNASLDRYAGASATRFAAAGSAIENHVYVEDKAHSIVVIPLKSMLRPDAKKSKIKTRKSLKKATAEAADPLPLAVFHTDIPLDKVFVRAPKVKGEKPKKRNPKKPEPPAVVRGECPAGTYVLGVWHTRLCLCHPSLEFVCFLSKAEATTDVIDLQSIKPEDRGAAEIEVDADADVVFTGFQVPVGGKDADEKLTLVVKTVTLTPKEGALTAAGTWRNYSKSDE